MNIRSTYKIASKPACIVDNDVTFWGGRGVFAMPCNTANYVADAREVWATTAFPNVMRWNMWWLKL